MGRPREGLGGIMAPDQRHGTTVFVVGQTSTSTTLREAPIDPIR
jgi:hypothetical protein